MEAGAVSIGVTERVVAHDESMSAAMAHNARKLPAFATSFDQLRQRD